MSDLGAYIGIIGCLILVAACVINEHVPAKQRHCKRCASSGRVNHRCGMVCVDDPCPDCQGGLAP